MSSNYLRQTSHLFSSQWGFTVYNTERQNLMQSAYPHSKVKVFVVYIDNTVWAQRICCSHTKMFRQIIREQRSPYQPDCPPSLISSVWCSSIWIWILNDSVSGHWRLRSDYAKTHCFTKPLLCLVVKWARQRLQSKLDWLPSPSIWYMNQHKNNLHVYLQKSYLLGCPSLWFGWSVRSFRLFREMICIEK